MTARRRSGKTRALWRHRRWWWRHIRFRRPAVDVRLPPTLQRTQQTIAVNLQPERSIEWPLYVIYQYLSISLCYFRTKRDVSRITPIFHTAFYLNCTIPKNPFEFLPKILIQSVPYRWAIRQCIILPKSPSLCLGWNNVTDDRQTTDGRLMPYAERNVVTFD